MSAPVLDSADDAKNYGRIVKWAHGLRTTLWEVKRRLEEDYAQDYPEMYVLWIEKRVPERLQTIINDLGPLDFFQGFGATSDEQFLCDQVIRIFRNIKKDILSPAKRASARYHDDARTIAQLELIRIDAEKMTKDLDLLISKMINRKENYSGGHFTHPKETPGDRNIVSITGTVHGDVNVGSGGNSSFNKGLSGQDLASFFSGIDSMVSNLLPLFSEPDQKMVKLGVEMMKEGSQDVDRKKWYSCGAEGVVEAATKVGAAGLPLIELVQKLTSLLGY